MNTAWLQNGATLNRQVRTHKFSTAVQTYFKLATLTFKALHTGRPPYFSDLLHYHEPMRSLRSSSSHQLSVPRHNLSFGSRALPFSAPRVWNPLPLSIRESYSLPTFRSNLNTFYFQSAYLTSAAHLA